MVRLPRRECPEMSGWRWGSRNLGEGEDGWLHGAALVRNLGDQAFRIVLFGGLGSPGHDRRSRCGGNPIMQHYRSGSLRRE